MSTDIGKEIQFSPDERVQIERNLMTVIQALYGCSCMGIIVPDYDFGRALVSGNEALLKIAIDERSQEWGVGKLKSSNAEFQILDFTKFKDPQAVVTEAMSQIPNIKKVNPTVEGRDFNDFYPGKVMAIIGAENIPQGVDVFELNVIAKKAPTVFIHREGMNFEQMNRHVQRAVGEYSNGTDRAQK